MMMATSIRWGLQAQKRITGPPQTLPWETGQMAEPLPSQKGTSERSHKVTLTHTAKLPLGRAGEASCLERPRYLGTICDTAALTDWLKRA